MDLLKGDSIHIQQTTVLFLFCEMSGRTHDALWREHRETQIDQDVPHRFLKHRALPSFESGLSYYCSHGYFLLLRLMILIMIIIALVTIACKSTKVTAVCGRPRRSAVSQYANQQ